MTATADLELREALSRDGRPARVPDILLATALVVFTEIMLFAALISSWVVLRSGFSSWPPMGQPRLPVEVTGVNTAILLASGGFAWRATRTPREAWARASLRAAALGGVFLAVQGFEWARLLSYGLEARGNVYGALFYTVVGVHAAHVIAGLFMIVLMSLRGGRECMLSARMYWLFVVAVWPPLYALVYLW